MLTTLPPPQVNITLTEAGLAAGEGFGLAAVELLFQYLAMLRAAGPQEWVWQELKVRRGTVLIVLRFYAFVCFRML